jgi:hypothetical protein
MIYSFTYNGMSANWFFSSQVPDSPPGGGRVWKRRKLDLQKLFADMVRYSPPTDKFVGIIAKSSEEFFNRMVTAYDLTDLVEETPMKEFIHNINYPTDGPRLKIVVLRGGGFTPPKVVKKVETKEKEVV